MKEKVIKWQTGDGCITARYDGVKDGPIEIVTEENDGLDREQTLTVQPTAGNAATLTVRQEGKRQEYITPDSEVYTTADGEIYAVIKED